MSSRFQSFEGPSFHFDTFESLNETNQFLNEIVSQQSSGVGNSSSSSIPPASPLFTAPSITTREQSPVPTQSASLRKKVSRHRRQLPENKDYIPETKPSQFDVIAGRGGRTNHHAGNRRYWCQVLRERPAYQACKCNDEKKNAIAYRIIDFVGENGGRFLQLDTQANRWFILPRKATIVKVKQALRDRHTPKWARADVTGPGAGPEEPQTAKKTSSLELAEFLNSVVFSSMSAVEPSKPLGFEEGLGSLMKNGDEGTSWEKSITSARHLPDDVQAATRSGIDLVKEGASTKENAAFCWDSMFAEALAPPASPPGAA